MSELYLILFSCLIGFISSQSPFPSCQSKLVFSGTYSISCSQAIFPDRSNSTITNINYLLFTNLKNIPTDAFKNFQINVLQFSNTTISDISPDAFRGIRTISSLILENVQNPSALLNTVQMENLQGRVSAIYISDYPSMNDSTIFDIFNGTRNLRFIQLIFSGNNFPNVNWDLSFYSNLTLLSLESNRVENLRLKVSKSLLTLYIYSNKITQIQIECDDSAPSLGTLYLHNNKIQSITNQTFSRFIRLDNLDLSNNLISSISTGAFSSLTQLSRLDLSNNPLSLNTKLYGLSSIINLGLKNCSYTEISLSLLGNPLSLSILDLSFNSISNISLFTDFQKLTKLYLSNNLIQDVEFPQLFNITHINLAYNKIEIIKNSSFKYLPSLFSLDLSSNRINKIESNSFEFNTKLYELKLGDNYLSSFPNISSLGQLQTLIMSNQNAKLTSLENYIFGRNYYQINLLLANLNVDLSSNNLTLAMPQLFCAKVGARLPQNLLIFKLDNLNFMHKCILKQLNAVDSVRIDSSVRADCSLKAMSLFKTKVYLNDNANYMTWCQNYSLVDDCNLEKNFQFNCTNKPESYERVTTWINGDPHVFSYKKNYQICVIGENKVCLRTDYFIIYCSDSSISKNSDATMLTKVSFAFTGVEDKQFDFLDYSGGSRVIYHIKTGTHIILTKFKQYYSLSVRMSKYWYTQSTTRGILVDGCETSSTKKLSKMDNLINSDCSIACNNLVSNTSSNIIDPLIASQSCLYDCSQVGNSSLIDMYNIAFKSIELAQNTDYKPDTQTLKDSFQELASVLKEDLITIITNNSTAAPVIGTGIILNNKTTSFGSETKHDKVILVLNFFAYFLYLFF